MNKKKLIIVALIAVTMLLTIIIALLLLRKKPGVSCERFLFTPSAVAEYKRKADAGDAEAQLRYSRALLFSSGAETNRLQAFTYACKAAEQGYEKAFLQVALGCAYGWGGAIDEKKAAAMFNQFRNWVETNKDAESCSWLAWAYSEDRPKLGVKQNLPAMILWLRRSADLNSIEGQESLASCYYNGFGVEKSYADAILWWRKAAEKGSTVAQVQIGGCYLEGTGVEKNQKEAMSWFLKAAEQGDALGELFAGEGFAVGSGVEEDLVEAVRFYKRASERGLARARYKLAMCYKNGTGVAKDDSQAWCLLLSAAELGDNEAIVKVGWAYCNGDGVEKDESEAVKWFEKGVAKGDVDALISLGCCYEDGCGVKQDLDKAEEIFNKALSIKDSLNIKDNISRIKRKKNEPRSFCGFVFGDVINGATSLNDRFKSRWCKLNRNFRSFKDVLLWVGVQSNRLYGMEMHSDCYTESELDEEFNAVTRIIEKKYGIEHYHLQHSSDGEKLYELNYFQFWDIHIEVYRFYSACVISRIPPPHSSREAQPEESIRAAGPMLVIRVINTKLREEVCKEIKRWAADEGVDTL